MKQDWTDKLKDRLEDFSQPVPEGLWEDIESSIKARRSPVRIFAPLLAGMAAAAASLFILIPHGRKDNPVQPEIIGAAPAILAESTIPDMPEETVPPVCRVSRPMPGHASPEQIIPELIIPEQISESGQTAETTENTDVATAVGKDVKQEEILDIPLFDKISGSPASSKGKLSVGVHMGGMSTNRAGMASHPFMAQDASYGSLLAFSPEAFCNTGIMSAEDYDWSVSFQANALARAYITDKTSVASGLSLIVMEGSQDYVQDKVRAGYLGVPLQVNYDILKTGRFRMSINAGATASVCVFGPDAIETNRWQLSADAGIGALYLLGRRTGIQAGIGAETFFATPGGGPGMFRKATTLMKADAGLVWLLF